MTAQDLKNSILQQAIQGKLVPQNPSDEPASELLKKIAEERQKLIDEGKIKNVPLLPPIEDNEKPFDIPDSWQWVRLGNLVYNRQQKKPDNKFSYIDIGSIDNVHQKLNEKENIINPEEAPSRARKPVNVGDIIYSTVRPYLHNATIIDRKSIYEMIASTGFAAMVCFEGLLNKYLLSFLISPTFDNYANAIGNSKGMAYPAINDKTFYNATIPLPPFAEQKRIVAKLEELMPLLERYDAAEKKLSALDKEFPDKLRKSILQQAIQGKLTEQLSSDGDARDLLEKIRAEKAKLIADGKIKKEKPLPPIKDDEKPFDIPDSWQWVRLGEIGETNIGLTYSLENISNDGTIVLRSGNIQNGKMDYADIVKVNLEIPESKFCCRGDILICARNGSKKLVGKAALIDRDNVTFGAFMAKFRSKCNEYILLVINSPYFRKMLSGDVGTMTINQITQGMLKSAVIPLPPLAEQKRIVEKLNELLPLCDALSEKINHF